LWEKKGEFHQWESEELCHTSIRGESRGEGGGGSIAYARKGQKRAGGATPSAKKLRKSRDSFVQGFRHKNTLSTRGSSLLSPMWERGRGNFSGRKFGKECPWTYISIPPEGEHLAGNLCFGVSFIYLSVRGKRGPSLEKLATLRQRKEKNPPPRKVSSRSITARQGGKKGKVTQRTLEFIESGSSASCIGPRFLLVWRRFSLGDGKKGPPLPTAVKKERKEFWTKTILLFTER